MFTQNTGRGSGGLTPLVLRLAVASVLAAAGAGKLAQRPQPIESGLPVESATIPSAPAPADFSEATDLLDVAPVLPGVSPDGEDSVRFDLRRDQLAGLGELAFAAMLLVGFLTRLTVLAGLGAITTSALAAHNVIESNAPLDVLSSLYTSNPLAALLLGAICLALLVSGSGALGLDRLLFGRRQVRMPAEPAVNQ